MTNTMPETLPTTPAGWLHRCDQRFADGYQKGRASVHALAADERLLVALQMLEDAYFKRGLPAFENAAEHIEHAAGLIAQAPAGYVLVPIEPTQRMCQEGQWKAQEWPHFPLRIVPIWKAMLAAAKEQG